MSRLLSQLTFWLAMAGLTVSCGPSGGDAVLAASLSKPCASNHDCGGNQRCVEKVCELVENACVSHTDCGSRQCDGGYCSLPSPALLREGGVENRSPEAYLAAGQDGFVDARGGLLVRLVTRAVVQKNAILWGEWEVQGWEAQSAKPSGWRIVEGRSNPERFVLRNTETNAELFAYVAPLPSQERSSITQTLPNFATKLQGALTAEIPFTEALVAGSKSGSVRVEPKELKDEPIRGFEAVRFEGLRDSAGGQRFRIWITRQVFGDVHYIGYIGLVAPVAVYTEHLSDLRDFSDMVDFAGVDAKVGAK